MTESIYAVIVPWFVSACLFIAFCIGIGKIAMLLSHIKRYPLHVVTALFLLLFVGAWIRFSWVPDGHRILFDEDRYLSLAVSFAKFNKSTSLDFATPERSIIGVPDHAIRVTVPVMHGWILRLFGDTETILFRFSRIMSIIQIFLIFVASYLLFESFIIAIWSALGIALLPVSVYWSVSLTLDNYFVFFSLLGLVSSSLYAKKNTLVNGVFFLCSLFLLLCVRFEGFLFLPILLGVIGYIWYKQKKTRVQKIDVVFAICIILFIGIRGLLSLSVLTKTWCCAENIPLEAFSIQYIVRNILPNLISFFGQKEFPFIITLLAIYTLFYKPTVMVWLMGAWILFFFSLYSMYYAGMFFAYEFSGSYGRYFLIFTVPLLFLSGMALEYCWNIIKKPKTNRIPWIIAIALALATLIPTISAYKKMVHTSPYDRIVELGPRLMHIFLTDYIIPNIPPNSVLIFPLTANTLQYGHTAIYNDTFNKRDDVKTTVVSYLLKGQRVFELHTYTCDLFPEKCVRFNELFLSTPYLSATLEHTLFQIDELTLKK